MTVPRVISICLFPLLSCVAFYFVVSAYVSNSHREEIIKSGRLLAERFNRSGSELPPCYAMEFMALRGFSMTEIMKNFQRCTQSHWTRFAGEPEQLFRNWPYIFYVCDDDPPVSRIPLLPFPSMNKTYWGVTPQCVDRYVLVTLGIRNDTVAVEMMRKKFPNLVTFGTNAWMKNSEDYDHFYNYAIGVNGTGIQTIYKNNGEIGMLKERSVKSFFKDVIAEKVIDMMWINLEGGEFEYWNYIGKFEEFDNLSIIVCQINLEVPQEDALHFEKFLKKFYKYWKYIFMRAMITKEKTTRLYLINIEDSSCVRKYLK